MWLFLRAAVAESRGLIGPRLLASFQSIKQEVGMKLALLSSNLLLAAIGVATISGGVSAQIQLAENNSQVVAPASAQSDVQAPVKSIAAAVNPDRIRFVHSGGSDCPPCVNWRGIELPKLQKSTAFQAINFSYVIKTIASPFPPPEFFLPAELKPLRAKLEHASGGRAGSPQQLLMVDGEVYDYWVGDEYAAIILARIAAITAGTEYPGKRCIRARPTRGPLVCVQYADSK